MVVVPQDEELAKTEKRTEKKSASVGFVNDAASTEQESRLVEKVAHKHKKHDVKAETGEESWLHIARDLVAGTFGGILQVIAGHPLDTIKVRLQTQAMTPAPPFPGHFAPITPATSSSSSSPSSPSNSRSSISRVRVKGQRYDGTIHCAKSIWAHEGPLGFFKGMASPLTGMAALNAILFATYGECNKYYLRQNQGAPLTTYQHTLSGCVAGFVQCIVVGPTELIKARLQIQGDAVSTSGRCSRGRLVFAGPIDCIKQSYSRHGIKGLMAGMSGTIYREIPGYAVLFACYEGLKTMIMPMPTAVPARDMEVLGHQVVEHDIDYSLYPGRLMLAGGLAGVACWTVSYPQDVVLNRLRVQPIDRPPIYRKHPLLFDGGFFDCARGMLKNEGVRSFFRGYSACALRAFPANAASFLGYEFIKGIWQI